MFLCVSRKLRLINLTSANTVYILGQLKLLDPIFGFAKLVCGPFQQNNMHTNFIFAKTSQESNVPKAKELLRCYCPDLYTVSVSYRPLRLEATPNSTSSSNTNLLFRQFTMMKICGQPNFTARTTKRWQI